MLLVIRMGNARNACHKQQPGLNQASHALAAGDISLCQDAIGWKAPDQSSQPTTPKQQKAAQHQQASHQEAEGLPVKQLDVTQGPLVNGDVDSPTATSNGPAVQPISAKKNGEKGKGKPQQATEDAGGQGAKVNEDPEKKAKKVIILPVPRDSKHLLVQAYLLIDAHDAASMQKMSQR